MAINLLDSMIINRISAGEVVESPFSIVKELIDNAIDAHSTKINVEIKNGGIDYICVKDNGKGIAKKELGHIFERCYRTDASRNSAQGGSGLGLSIAKKIIEEHGGRIWATSKEGIGTSICFVIRKYITIIHYINRSK